MKFCSFTTEQGASWGLVTDAGIVDLGKRGVAKTLRAFLAQQDLSPAKALLDAPTDYAFDEV